jgi:hypothetical protein
MANPEGSVTVQERPPSRARASIRRQSIPASWIFRAAAMPAAPPPMTATSIVSFVMGIP